MDAARVDAWYAHQAMVLQASGMVSVQADVPLIDAIGMLCNRADAEGVSVDEVGRNVMDRRIRFDFSRELDGALVAARPSPL
jgi:hypothetical protein